MVQIHGNWCGPNWTGGQKVAAEDYKGPWDGPVETPLDACCRAHDLDCSKGGCSSAGDAKLISCSEARILSFIDSAKLELKLSALVLQGKGSGLRAKAIRKRLNESSDAALISAGISIVKPFRRR